MVNAGRHTGSQTAQGTRAGQYLPQPEGYRAFIPAPLPPTPPVQITGDLQRLLSEADRALGRLDGSVQTLPNPDLFVYMYVRKEAVLSSQIEGTQSSLQDLLAAEAHILGEGRPRSGPTSRPPSVRPPHSRDSRRAAQGRARFAAHAWRTAPQPELDRSEWLHARGSDVRSSASRGSADDTRRARDVSSSVGRPAVTREGWLGARAVRDHPSVSRWQRPCRAAPHHLPAL